MRGFIRFAVIAFTTGTLLLLAAVGAAAASGSLGASKPIMSVTLVAANTSKAQKDDNGKHKGQCHPPKKHHKHGTPGHKNHPCGDNDDDSD